MAELVTAEVCASQRPSMQPLPQVYQPALQSAERGAGTAPARSVAAGEKGELAEYFGVSWTPEVSSRSPGGRVRRAVGRFSSVTESPMRYKSASHTISICLPPGSTASASCQRYNLPYIWLCREVVATACAWASSLHIMCHVPDMQFLPCSTLGPLDGQLPGSAPRASSGPFPETPPVARAPTWEDLHMIQTRAMLELRVQHLPLTDPCYSLT